jgi:cell division protein FtsB
LNSVKKRIKNLSKRFSKTTDQRLASLPSFGSARTMVWIVVGLIFVWLIYLAQSSHAAVVARDLRVKQLQLEALNRENAQLRFDIAQLTAPSAIEERARKLGLGPPQNVFYATLPELHVDASELMPAFAPQTQNMTGEAMLASDTNVWEQLLALFGFSSSDRAQAQGK